MTRRGDFAVLLDQCAGPAAGARSPAPADADKLVDTVAALVAGSHREGRSALRIETARAGSRRLPPRSLLLLRAIGPAAAITAGVTACTPPPSTAAHAQSLEHCCAEPIALARAPGSRDNITAVLALVERQSVSIYTMQIEFLQRNVDLSLRKMLFCRRSPTLSFPRLVWTTAVPTFAGTEKGRA